MPSRRAATAARRRAEVAAARRRRTLAVLIVVLAVLIVVLLLTAFGSGRQATVQAPAPAPSDRLLPAGPPSPQVVALEGALRIQLPVAQARVTAIGYHATPDGAIPLEPLGSQANEGTIARLVHRIFGGGSHGLRWFQIPGGQGPPTAALDVGAPVGTDVYSPVDGTIVGVTPNVIDGKTFGARIDIEPTGAPALIVSVSHLRPDPSLTVGATVAAGTSKLGLLLDLSRVEQQALARYTQDAGNHVEIEARPAAALATP
jgi:murein DD-endopeptidase MepM/ murein hydrolase activator NlpD